MKTKLITIKNHYVLAFETKEAAMLANSGRWSISKNTAETSANYWATKTGCSVWFTSPVDVLLVFRKSICKHGKNLKLSKILVGERTGWMVTPPWIRFRMVQ